MKRLLFPVLMLALSALLPACGDGTSSHGSSTVKAVIKTSSLTADRNIAGINLTISLPVGVSPLFLANGSVDPSATVEITSTAPEGQKLPGVSFRAGTASAVGELTVSAIIASGFRASDTVTIHLVVAEGAFPEAGDFKLLSFDAFDFNGAKVTGLSPTLSTSIN